MDTVHHTLSLTLLPLKEEDSSLSSPDPVGNPSLRRQSSTILPMWVLSTSYDSSLPAPAVLHGLTSLASKHDPAWIHVFLQDHRSCQNPDPVWDSHSIAASLQRDLCYTMHLCSVSPQAVGTQLLHHGLHHRLQRNLCSSAWSTLPPSFTLMCAGLSLTYSSVIAAIVLQQIFPLKLLS